MGLKLLGLILIRLSILCNLHTALLVAPLAFFSPITHHISQALAIQLPQLLQLLPLHTRSELAVQLATQLSQHSNWKVRQAVTSSLARLAAVLNPQVSTGEGDSSAHQEHVECTTTARATSSQASSLDMMGMGVSVPVEAGFDQALRSQVHLASLLIHPLAEVCQGWDADNNNNLGSHVK